MIPADIPTAVAIEQAAYASVHPKKDYFHELERNQLAYYFVLRVASQVDRQRENRTVGVGGFWLMDTEIHIVTLAMEPGWQGLGLGELLLIALLDEGHELEADVATLEVRPSNQAAISLYKKYRFQEVGRRAGYYGNNGEDALILTSPLLRLPDYQAMLTKRKTKLLQRLAKIKIDKINQIN